MVTHLPPGFVGLLNAVFWGQEQYEEELDEFRQAWDAVKRWLSFHGTYHVNEKEQRDLENLSLLWEDVDSQLGGVEPLSFDRLAPPVYEAVSLMNQINENRRFPHYSPVPAVNEVLLAGAAYCMDQGSEQGLRDRLPLLNECVENLRGLYYEQESGFPEEVRDTLLQGLDMVEQGIGKIHHGLPNKEEAQDGLADVKDGGSLAEFLLDWDRKEKERLNSTYSRFNIPMIGTDLEIGLESVKSVDRRKWRRGAKSTEEDLFPQLAEFWSQVRSHLILPPDEREEILLNVDEATGALGEAVANLKGKEFEDQELVEALEEALEWASEAFTSVEESTLKADHFGFGEEREIFDCIKGVLAGSVPDAALLELKEKSSVPTEVEQQFQAFLQEPHEDYLFQAAWLLFDRVEAAEEQAAVNEQPWTCHLCGQVNDPSSPSCESCRVIRKV